MRPKPPDPAAQPELFRARLDNLVDPRHPLVRLAGLIDWQRFENSFGPLYKDGVGRPGLPTRLMVGLHLLVNRRRNLTPDRRPKLTLSGGLRR